MARVYESEHDSRAERVIYRVMGVDSKADQRWPTYARSLLAFSAVSVLFLYALQRFQSHLPLSLGFPGVSPAQALAVVGAIVLLALGAVQNFSAGSDATTLAGVHQTITGGPVASQEAIKELGTNGGGFYNANSSHPFENPNPLSNIFEIFFLLLIPVALTRTFGLMVKDKRQGYAILAVMGLLWGLILTGVSIAEAGHHGTALNLAGASMEGKETRFGVAASSLFATSTTGTSTGSVNSFHDSFTSLGGGQLIFNMGLGEVAPGGTGSGLYGILVLAIATVFIAGLMVGRTPEYLRKKITTREIKLVSLYILTMPVLVLAGTGTATMWWTSGSLPPSGIWWRFCCDTRESCSVSASC